MRMSTLSQWREAFATSDDACPWPGPRPLDESNSMLLFGRDKDRAAFRRDIDAHRLVLLTGVSGVGKTSLLRAGLVPELRESGYTVAVCRDWSGSADEKDSLDYLVRIVRRELLRQGVADLAEGAELIWQLDRRFGQRAVIVLDQFEELIRDAERFKNDLYEVLAEINHRTSIKIVVSFRSEYLHALRPLESKARPFTVSHYYLDDIDPSNADALVRAANTDDRIAIDDHAAHLVVTEWQRAQGETDFRRGSVGLLHLQALLYALHDDAGGRTVTWDTLIGFRERHGADEHGLFWCALRAAVEVKLARCRAASAARDLDSYLVEGTADLLARLVKHLSSDGYKLVRSVRDLTSVTFGSQLEALRSAMALSRPAPGAAPDGAVTAQQEEALLAGLVELITAEEREDQSSGAVIDGAVTAPSVDLLRSDRAAIAVRADAATSTTPLVGWSDRLDARAAASLLDPTGVTSGPMLGLTPAAVFVEELRRFAFALEWLRAAGLVRLSTPLAGETTVALIHDGFGIALERWSEEVRRRPAGALHSLTSPTGADFDWVSHGAIAEDAKEALGALGLGSGFLPELDGRLLANVRWRGAGVHAAFRGVAFVNCDLRGTLFRECLFEGVMFVNCQLDGVMFSDCTIVGPPTKTNRDWNYEPPEYCIESGSVAVDIARYRGGAPASAQLLAQVTGLPAVAAESRETATALPLATESGGLVVYGGVLSSLVLRSCTFERDGRISFRQTTGSGLDVVEIDDSGVYDIVGCTLRHVSFTGTSTDTVKAELSINVVGSAVAQLWVGDGLRGELDFDDCLLVHVWNGSGELTARAHTGSRFHGVVNVDVDESCSGKLAEEAATPLEIVDQGGDIARVARGMTYRRHPAAPPTS